MTEIIDWPVVALQVLVLLVLSGFWIWALVDSIRNAPPESKVAWVVVIALTHSLGATLYVLFGRRVGAAESRQRNL